MERERSLSASSSDSWSVIDHRRTSSCDDSDDGEQSINLSMDGDHAVIVDEAFVPSYDEDDDDVIDESDMDIDSDIEVAHEESDDDDENDELEELDETQDEDSDDDSETDQDEDDNDEEEELEKNKKREVEEDDEEEEKEEEEEEEIEVQSEECYSTDEDETESVWVNREDIRDSGGLYFECPEHIKSSFDEIDRKEGWKLIARAILFYLGMVGASLVLQAGWQMYKKEMPEPDYPVLVVDIYGLQYHGIGVDVQDMSFSRSSSAVCPTREYISNTSRCQQRRHSWRSALLAMRANRKSGKEWASEIPSGFSSHITFSSDMYLRRNNSRFEVLSRLVQSRPNSSSHISTFTRITRSTLTVGTNSSSFCPRWSTPALTRPMLRRAPSIQSMPQVAAARRQAKLVEHVCVRPKSNKAVRAFAQVRGPTRPPTSFAQRMKSLPKTRVTSKCLRAPVQIPKKCSKKPPMLFQTTRRIRLAKPNILIAPPRNRITMPKNNISTISSPSCAIKKSKRLSSWTSRHNNPVPKPSVTRPLLPRTYKAPKPKTYAVGPVHQRSLAPCVPKKSVIPSFKKPKVLYHEQAYISSFEKSNNVLYGTNTNKTKHYGQCGNRFWKKRKNQMNQRHRESRKEIDHKLPVPCAAKYKLESSLVARKRYNVAEIRLQSNYKYQGKTYNSSIIRKGYKKMKKDIIPSKKIVQPKCHFDSRPRKHHEWKLKQMAKYHSHTSIF